MAIEITPALEQDLEHLAVEYRTSVGELAQRALEEFVACEGDLCAAAKRGDADIAAGRLLDHEEVVERIDRLLASR